MKERPIPLYEFEVRNLLRGGGEIRRVMKPQPVYATQDVWPHDPTWCYWPKCGPWVPESSMPDILTQFCPYGQVGDRLWVREKALYWSGGAGGTSEVVYSDDPEIPQLLEDNNRLLFPRELSNGVVGKWRWRPSIFMPREFSRITRTIAYLRAERLWDITYKGIVAEGYSDPFHWPALLSASEMRGKLKAADDWYEYLWDSINAKRGYPYSSNPGTWVIGMSEGVK